MIGAESLVRTLLASGVDVCFANPGTSEMHFVAALDRAPAMRCILGLFEGVVSGAADGYARMAGKPAATLFHCGPGLGNAIANLHNAKRAKVPVVNIVGDQATYHAPLEPPLASDIESLAHPVSAWVKKVMRTEDVGLAAAAAVQAARRPPTGIATLILPSDVSWSDGGAVAHPLPVPQRKRVSDDAVEEAATVLRLRAPTLMILDGEALSEHALSDAARIAATTGARITAPTFNTRIARGRGRYPIPRIPYVVDEAVAEQTDIKHVILVGAAQPVTFFAYPGKPGITTPKDAKVHVLAKPEDDLPDALERLADVLKCPNTAIPDRADPPAQPRGRVTIEGAAEILTALMPENAVVVEEAITLRHPLYVATARAAPHDWLEIPGGSIGGGLPLATGAAVGAPGRRVIVLQADGSGMYTVQALWTQARENLDVTMIVLANKKYAVLFRELTAVGATPGRNATDMFEIGRPDLDWVLMAKGMGVEGARADSLERFADLLSHANVRRGPFLIELMIE